MARVLEQVAPRMAGQTISNWKGEPIKVARSKGGVLVTASPFDNLIRPRNCPWPPPEIVQKLYQSRQVRAFSRQELDMVRSGLGYYCDLQSLNSEDAITWSVFGTVAYEPPEDRLRFVRSFFELLGVAIPTPARADIWLWRRLPHPDTLVPGGPEIDFGIQTDRALLLGEAKWKSAISCQQGKARNKDQLTLRKEFFQKFGKKLFPGAQCFGLCAVSLNGGLLVPGEADGPTPVLSRDVTWDAVCNIEHTLASELKAYLDWKRRHSLPQAFQGTSR